MKEFRAFDKIARLKRAALVTEKIDGSNAQITWDPVPDGDIAAYEAINGVPLLYTHVVVLMGTQLHALWVGSRNRWIKPGKDTDNFGFAAWAADRYADLARLGPGSHYGEWWGKGIQRGYLRTEKRFSLFNVGRWRDQHGTPRASGVFDAPECCYVVPTLYHGDFDTSNIEEVMAHLKAGGSIAAPGFDNPEGVVVYHVASRTLFKRTFEKDAEGKGE